MQTSKFRIVEQASISSDDPQARVAVPAPLPMHHSASQAAAHNENQFADPKTAPRAEPTTSNKVIIDPGATAKARRAALGHSGTSSGGEINAVAPSQKQL